ncbi:hypothetical protein DPMN_050429 [Dreissena polymorpha]|uniref:Sushi domain-containing protein n=1 Tax=Dreissena polymorpha TaxID=45954 RepID=A0A9D4CG41_DREPO|nr:hypothetical protein DPMN_050429 [Dreissena polymorpha]
MFERTINFVIFRIACPALNNTRTQTSNWHFDTQEVGHNTNVTLTCAAGFWWQPSSLSGHPNTTNTVNCGSDGNWTPSLKDCVSISMNILRELFDIVPCS